MSENDISKAGHCSLGACSSYGDGWGTISSPTPARIIGADFAAPNTESETVVWDHTNLSFISEEDFDLMLEVDLAYVDWLLRRRFI